MVHYTDELPEVNYSEFISEKLGYDYTYLANVFSEVKGTTIQHFIIMHKIERVKELLLYEELNLTELVRAPLLPIALRPTAHAHRRLCCLAMGLRYRRRCARFRRDSCRADRTAVDQREARREL